MERRRQVELLAYTVDALRLQERRYRQAHWPVPAGVSELVDSVGFRVSQGHAGSSDAAVLPEAQAVSESRLLLRYETAARVLDVSLSTLKRLVKTRELHPVRVAGAARIRVADLEEYVAGLDEGDERSQ